MSSHSKCVLQVPTPRPPPVCTRLECLKHLGPEARRTRAVRLHDPIAFDAIAASTYRNPVGPFAPLQRAQPTTATKHFGLLQRITLAKPIVSR